MTEVTKKDGSKVDFSVDSDLAQLLLEMIPDKAMQSLLLETRIDREPDPSNINLGSYSIIHVMKRILNTAYMITLCRWKQLRDDTSWGEHDDISYFENSRFTKLFQSALSGEDITFDLQIFSLMELWVDLKKTHSLVREQFSMIFDNRITGNDIGLMLQMVRDAVKNASFKEHNGIGKYTKAYCNELCYLLLRAFKIVRRASIVYPEDSRLDDDHDFVIKYTFDDEEGEPLYPNAIFSNEKFIVSEQQLLLMGGEQKAQKVRRLILYMRTEASAFGGKYQNRYTSFDGEKQTFINVEAANEQPQSAAIIKDIHETKKFLSFSYKNIREFAMIINDSIKDIPNKRNELFLICQKQYPKIIADIKSCDAPNIYWDNIITLMMLEMGISDFLEKVLDPAVFNNVLDNIAWRYKGRSALGDIRSAHEREVQQINELRLKSTSDAEMKMYNKRELRLRVKTVLRAMNFNIEDDDTRNPFLDSLSYKYGKVVACIKRLQNRSGGLDIMTSTAAELQRIFADIFTFLQIFYTGLNSYATVLKKKNEEYAAELDAMTEELQGDSTQISVEARQNKEDELRHKKFEIRKACDAEFIKVAKEKLAEIKSQTVSQLFNGFCDICMRYNTFSDRCACNISEEAKNLKYLITRNYICDARKLQSFAEVKREGDKVVTIFDVLSNLQAYNSDPDYPKWLTYLQDIFMFLIYNEDYNERGLWSRSEKLEDKDCDPIYPYVVTYYKENLDRDNVKKCSYHVPLPVSGNENDGYVVTLLTDDDYPPQTYFCIPLRYGSSERWWINPFLIPKRVIRRIGYPDRNAKTQKEDL
ncbi:MAG: hypothetical protein K2M48_05350 [Clostridiales bacterium]|nr:hypothetical protein [Clostridiales bacterium]